jgi:hypothetical protein
MIKHKHLQSWMFKAGLTDAQGQIIPCIHVHIPSSIAMTLLTKEDLWDKSMVDTSHAIPNLYFITGRTRIGSLKDVGG